MSSIAAKLSVRVRIVVEVEHLQTELMLVQAAAGIAFVPGALARLSIDGIASRPFTQPRGLTVVHAVWSDGTATGLVQAVALTRARGAPPRVEPPVSYGVSARGRPRSRLARGATSHTSLSAKYA